MDSRKARLEQGYQERDNYPDISDGWTLWDRRLRVVKSLTKRGSYHDDVGLLLGVAVRLLASMLGDLARSNGHTAERSLVGWREELRTQEVASGWTYSVVPVVLHIVASGDR